MLQADHLGDDATVAHELAGRQARRSALARGQHPAIARPVRQDHQRTGEPVQIPIAARCHDHGHICLGTCSHAVSRTPSRERYSSVSDAYADPER